jgi:hypothetical protein
LEIGCTMGVARLGGESKGENMVACKWCGRETIVVDGDTWQTICRECMDEAYDEAASLAEAAATGN